MITVIQRVSEANVAIEGKVTAQIGHGLLLLAGFEEADTEADLKWMGSKIVNLRIFPDENEVMNKSIMDSGGDILVVSQFTLHASTKKGNRPSYSKAAKSDVAIPLYNAFLNQLENVLGKKIASGEFGADMKVYLINDGPVTIIIDSKDSK